MPDADDESALLARVRGGDTRAFAGLLDAHLPHLRAFIALKLPVASLVDELAHETFVFAFRHIAEFTPGTSLRAWLRAIAWNLVRKETLRFAREQVNQSRYQQARLVEIERGHADHSGAELDALDDCLRAVPEEMRRLLTLRYADEHSTEEVATVFGRTLEWVRITLFRVRAQLRECIERKTSRHAR